MVQGRIKGLNSLRFIAAILVLAGHARLDLLKLSIPQPDIPALRAGSTAVEFFFVLSGFLLTHLALREFSGTGRIDIRGFYQRRILRIWPLYYLCVAIGFGLIAGIGPKLLGSEAPNISGLLPYFIFLLPNYAIALQPVNTGAVYALWSIGVEEQFYLFFPLLMSLLLRGKRPLAWIALLATAYSLFYLIAVARIQSQDETLYRFLHTLKFHYMLFGCTAALLWNRKSGWVDRVLPKGALTGWLLSGLAAYHVFVRFPSGHGLDVLPGLLYAAILLHMVRSDPPALLGGAIPEHLGMISYGIYMYHPYLSYLLRWAAKSVPACHAVFATLPLAYYLSLAALTLIVAHFSYRFFESRFLRLRSYPKVG